MFTDYKSKMAAKLSSQTSGGKGNMGCYIERDSNICAAGKPSQPEWTVKDLLTHDCLQDKVNAVIGDAIIPQPKVTEFSHKHDMRHAGIFSEGRDILNPPVKTKFQMLVADLKSTTYKSYWAEIGKVHDQIPLLPQGFKTYDTVLGKKNTYQNLYDIVMPVNPYPDKTPNSKKVGYQVNRNYFSYDPNATYGHKTNADPSGKFMKCCLRDNQVINGNVLKIPVPIKQAKYQYTTIPRLGVGRTAPDDIVPQGFTFGKLDPPNNPLDCLGSCKINPYKLEIKECLGQLNTLRKYLAKRFDQNFYRNFFLSLKFLDISESGWLQKHVVYSQCNAKCVRFNPSFIEPLLSLWHAFDGSQIEYKTFINVINPNKPSPEIPKMQDVEYKDFRTTYGECYKDSLSFDNNVSMNGIPHGRYFDKEYPVIPDSYCKSDQIHLPEESDAKSCLNPSLYTFLGASYRDMYAKRDPKLIKKVFENIGETFEDNQFETIWEIAKKYHSQEWVCFETFRRSLLEYQNMREREK